MYELLQLESLKDFSCIGGDCPDNCCHGWSIYINKPTYKKYKKSKDINIDNIVIIDKNNSNCYAEIKLKEDGNCPFLCESGLCGIHKNYGKNMLSGVCNIYPQNLVRYNDRVEKSIRLSCPAAVNLLFKSPNPLEFDLRVVEKKIVRLTENEDSKLNEHFSNEGYFAFRSLAITILQYRDISIKERLYALGRASYIIDNLIEAKEYSSEEIIAYIGELDSTFKKDTTFKMKEEINFNANEKFELIHKVLPILDEFLKSASNKNKTEAFDVIENGLANINKVTVEEMKNFKENVLDKFFLENQYVLEHYLVFKVFEEVFPKNSSSVMNAFNFMLNRLLMLYVYLVAMYKDYNKINLEDFKNVIYLFERQLSHSKFKKVVINSLNSHMKMEWDILLDIIF